MKYIFILSLIFVLNGCFWTSPSYYNYENPVELKEPIMTMPEYDSVVDTHPRPYIFNIETEKGAVCFFGSEHTKDINHSQFAIMEERWKSFNADVLLIEGRLGFLMEGFMNPVSNYGEMGFIKDIADDEDVDIYTWEQRPENEVQFLLKNYTPKQIALFIILRPYFSNYRFGPPEDPEDFVEDYISKRTSLPGLENTFSSVKEIDEYWKEVLPDADDWRNTSDQYGLPGYLAYIANDSNLSRDYHLVNVIIDLVKKGKRVFVVAGSSHAVRTEKTIRAHIDTN